jgi:hypothetical protein
MAAELIALCAELMDARSLSNGNNDVDLERLCKASCVEAGFEHIEPEICHAWRLGRFGGIMGDPSRAALPLGPNSSGLAARGFVPAAMSTRLAALNGALKHEWANKHERPTWPFADGDELLAHANVLRAAGDPTGADLLRRAHELNIAVAAWLLRVLGSRSRLAFGTWIAGDGWCAMRFPDPPSTIESGPPRRSVFVAVSADTIQSGPWAGWQPQLHGWQRMTTLTGQCLWKVFEGEDFEFDSLTQRPLRDVIGRHMILETGSGPMRPNLRSNTLLLGATVDKRLMQHTFDTLGYCWRGAGRVSDLRKLLVETYNGYSKHPLVGLLLGLGAAYAGNNSVNAHEAQAVMSLVKVAGSTKESNATHNKRSTFQDVIGHISFCVGSLSPETVTY